MKKKIVITLFALLLAVGVAGTVWGPSIAGAAVSFWNSCPRGEVNDVYPGDCNLYIDTNNDQICDRSQPAPQASTSDPNLGGSAISDSRGSLSVAPAADISPDAGAAAAAKPAKGHTYYFVPILVALVVLYSLTWILSARKAIGTLLHRKIWNVVLLAAFLVSAVLGIILLVNIEFGTNITPPFNMLFWHVEAGIALGVIAFFHIVWHWRYFAKIMGINRT